MLECLFTVSRSVLFSDKCLYTWVSQLQICSATALHQPRFGLHSLQYYYIGLYALKALEGQGHQCIFSLVRASYEEIVTTGEFQGHQGNDMGAWRQSPSLPP